VDHGPGPRLLTELSSGAATCSSGLGPASLSRWASVLPRVTWLRALPFQEESSDAATCSSAPNLAFLPMWAPTQPRGPGLTSPSGEIRCYHVPTGPSGLWTTRINKGLTASSTQLSSLVSKARSRVTEAPARRADRSLQLGSTVQRRPS
jgi:hypothetical protein